LDDWALRADTERDMARTLRSALTTLVALAAVSLAAAGPAAAHTVQFSWQPNPQRFWRVDGPAVISLFHNGQCTMWAQERRPDIVRQGVKAIVAQEIALNRPENMGNWDARFWPANAREAGIPTGHTPRTDALIVFQPGVLGAGASGHIAFVQQVYPDGSFLISEMHAPVLWRVTHQVLTAADGRLPGVAFIY
jgi:surface antigen